MRTFGGIAVVCLLLASCAPGGATLDGNRAEPVLLQSDSGVPAPWLSMIPERTSDHISGETFLSRTEEFSPSERQQAAVKEILSGNIPSGIRKLAPITLVSESDKELTVWVTKDYLSIGEEESSVRMPLSLPSAREIARSWGLYLPTPPLVDAIYEQADLKLVPEPMPPTEEMRSNDYYRRHQTAIEEQRGGRASNGLLAGHKKDLVVSVRMDDRPEQVAIYGWHWEKGDPIQSLSLVHEASYEDYSHGVRLIHPYGQLNGEWVPLVVLLDDLSWNGRLSREASLDWERLSWGE
ncbi:MAG: hypothetical protein ACQER4_06285 [Bacteroidota bacterium]